MNRFCAIVLLAAGGTAIAQPPASQPAGPSLTIYSTADPARFDRRRLRFTEGRSTGVAPGYAMVREVRRIELASGVNTVKISDIPADIDPTTVALRSLSAPDTTAVLEQSFESGPPDPFGLLARYIGREVLINRKPIGDARLGESKEGVLLAYDRDHLVLKTRNAQMPLEIIARNSDLAEIKLFSLPDGLANAPALTWKVQAQLAGPHDAQLTYETNGLTWCADYAMTLNKGESSVDLSAWASILNLCGVPFANARVKLVAGDVGRLVREPSDRDYGVALSIREAEPGSRMFSEYYVFSLEGATTLRHGAFKQVELMAPRRGIPVSKSYVYCGAVGVRRYLRPEAPYDDADPRSPNRRIDVLIAVQNTRKAGLGVPLPTGRVRVYKADADDDAPLLIGEDVIAHTPVDGSLTLRTGSAFDLAGDRKVTDFKLDTAARAITESVQITLRNHKKEAVKIAVREPLYRAAQWQITAKSDEFEKLDARTVGFTVDVPAREERKVTYTAKYSW